MVQFSNPKVSTEESCLSLDCPPRTRRPGGGVGSKDVPDEGKPVCLASLWFTLMLQLPGVGGAEKLKEQEAIPPFSLIVFSIHGRKEPTFVKTENPPWPHVWPSLLLTIPTRVCAPSLLTVVSGPPLSP